MDRAAQLPRPQEDSLTLREYASRSDLVPPGGRVWWTLLAILFCGGGLCMIGLSAREVVRCIGAVFFVIGLAQADSAVRAFRAHARGARLRARFGDLPWTRDYPWDTTGHRDGSLAMTMRSAAAGMFFFIVIVGVPVFVSYHGLWDSRLQAVIFTVVFGLMGLLFLYFLTIKKLRHYAEFGSSRLVFDRVPYVLGGVLNAQLIPGRRISYRRLQFTLRCIQPVLKRTRTSIGPKGQSAGRFIEVYRQMYADQIEFREPNDWSPGLPAIPISFSLPDRPLPTQLAAPMAELETDAEDEPVGDGKRYWEIEARATAKGLDYRTSFLVPVYARMQTEGNHTTRHQP
jgi:hypothetical protein